MMRLPGSVLSLKWLCETAFFVLVDMVVVG